MDARQVGRLCGLALLAGCASASPPLGHDYPQAAFGSFTLNVTTAEQAESLLGQPVRQSEVRGLAKPTTTLVTPGTLVTITTLNYYFAPNGVGPRGPHPVKNASLVFFNDRLVSYELSNGVPGEVMPPIDEARLAELRQGVTTRAEVIGMFGTPVGQRLHMDGPQRGQSEIAYGWIRQDQGSVSLRMVRIAFDTSSRLSTYTVLDSSFPKGGAPMLQFGPQNGSPRAPGTPMPSMPHGPAPHPDLEHT